MELCRLHHPSHHGELILDTTLSGLGSLAAALLMRGVSEAIPGFVWLVTKWVGFGMAWTILALLVFGHAKKRRRFAASRSHTRLLRVLAFKDTGMVLLALAEAPEILCTIQLFILILSDVLFSTAALFLPRVLVRAVRREEREIRISAGLPNALVAGTGRTAVAFAEEIENAGTHHVIGFLSQDPRQNGMVIGERIVFYAASGADLDALQWRLGGVDAIFYPGGYQRRL